MDEDASSTTQQQIRVSIYTPLIYVGVLVSSFIAFSIIYRRRRVNKLTKVEPIFSENHTASLYAFLKSQYVNPETPKDIKPHEKVMKAALLRRAVEAIRRSLKLKENESVFNKLYQEGLIGDEIFKQFEIQAQLQELELKDIVQEAESYKKGWVATFFPVAQEICFNEALRRRLDAMDGRSKSLSILWEYYVDLSEGKTESTSPSQKETKQVPVEVKKSIEDVVSPESKLTETPIESPVALSSASQDDKQFPESPKVESESGNKKSKNKKKSKK